MNINITQRQASLTIMVVSGATILAMLVAPILMPNFSVNTLPLSVALLILGSLCFIYYWYGWEICRFIYTLLTPFMLVASVPVEAFRIYVSVAILIPAITALVMTNPRWILIIGGLTWALLVEKTGGQGALIQPPGFLSTALCVIGLAISRVIMETAQRAAVESEERAKSQAKELRFRESYYRALMANLPNSAIVLFDQSLRFILVDGPEVDRMGYSKQEMEGKSLYEALPQASASAVEPNMRAVLMGKHFSKELPYRDQVYSYHYLPLEDDQHQIPYGLILAQNITVQRHTEETLRQNEERYRIISEMISDYAYAYNIDEAGHMKRAWTTGSFTQITGYTSEEIESNGTYTLFQEKDQERVRIEVERVIGGQEGSGEYEIINKWGEKRWLSIHRYPIWDENRERVIQFFGVAQDVTTRKKAEEALRKNEELLGVIISNLPLVFFVIDINGIFTMSEGKGLSRIGLKPGEAVGQSIFELYHDAPEVTASVRKALAGELTYSLNKMGDLMFEVFFNPMYDNQHDIVGVIGVGVDTTERKQAEESLAQERKLMRALIDHLPDNIYVKDREGRFVLNNVESMRILGVSRQEELLGKSDFDFIPTERSEKWLAEHEDIMQADKPIREKEVFQPWNPDERRWVVESMIPLHDDGGNVIGLIGINRDITKRKQAEEALQESKERYRMISDLISDYAFSYIVQPDGSIQTSWITEESYERLSGYTTKNDNNRATYRLYHPDEIERVAKDVQATIQGQPTEGEYRIITKSGEERWIYVKRRPLWSEEEQRVVGFYGAAQNMTERKQAEEALQESEERYRLISELISDYAFSYSVAPDGSIQSSWITQESYERLTGYRMPEDLPSRYGLYHPDDRERAQQDVLATSQGQPTASEYRIITKSGELRWIYLRRRPLWSDEEQRVIKVYGAAQNITERKHAEEQLQNLNTELEQRVIQRTNQLEEANQELEAFTYSVSHDLRAPLRAISGFSRTVGENYAFSLPEKAQYYLSRIESNASRMNTLINDLLNLSRMGRKEIRAEVVDMNSLVQKVLRELFTSGQTGAAQFTLGKLPPCYADTSLLQQVLVNIISNAIKYSAKTKHPHVEIASITKHNEIMYYTKDNGAGFDMQYADKLFGVFQRLHSENDFEGTGIGLATVKRIIVRHGGRVWAEGKVGQGATFYFVIGSPVSS